MLWATFILFSIYAVVQFLKMTDFVSDFAQALDRVCRLCRCIRQDMEIYEDGRDPQILDGLELQLDLFLTHLNRLGAHEEVVETTARALAALSQLRDECEPSCGLQLAFVNAAGPGRPWYCLSRAT